MMNKNIKSYQFLAIISIIFVASLTRLLPHPPNFTPIAAMAIFGGVHFSKKWLAFAVPLLSLLVSDMLLPYGFYEGMVWVYACFAAMVCIGFWIRSNANPVSLVFGSLVASVFFFLASNFGVWIGSNFYTHDFWGLMTCYVAGIPFFRNSILGDLTYTLLLFSAYEVIKNQLLVKINR